MSVRTQSEHKGVTCWNQTLAFISSAILAGVLYTQHRILSSAGVDLLKVVGATLGSMENQRSLKKVPKALFAEASRWRRWRAGKELDPVSPIGKS
jgi:hypothetical protein